MNFFHYQTIVKLQVQSQVKVKVLEVDKQGRVRLSMKALESAWSCNWLRVLW